MNAYRTPLPALFASALQAAINRVLALDAGSAGRLQSLAGRCLKLEVSTTGITLFFRFAAGQVTVSVDESGEPDAVITGSPAALFAMAAPGEAKRWGMPGSAVSIAGDAGVARDMETLFSQLEPDWEARLAGVFGDVLGFQLASGIRQGADQIRAAASASQDVMAEYLARNQGPMPGKEPFRQFADRVDALREGVDRLEAKIRVVTERREAAE